MHPFERRPTKKREPRVRTQAVDFQNRPRRRSWAFRVGKKKEAVNGRFEPKLLTPESIALPLAQKDSDYLFEIKLLLPGIERRIVIIRLPTFKNPRSPSSGATPLPSPGSPKAVARPRGVRWRSGGPGISRGILRQA